MPAKVVCVWQDFIIPDFIINSLVVVWRYISAGCPGAGSHSGLNTQGAQALIFNSMKVDLYDSFPAESDIDFVITSDNDIAEVPA